MPAATGNPIGLRGVDQFLTSVARAYKPHGLAAERVAPSISVTRDSDLYPIFPGFFDDETDNKVPDRAPTPVIDFEWSTDTYLCEDYRLAADVTDKELRNAHNVLRLRQNKLDTVLIRMALRRERRIAATLRQVGDGGQLTGGSHVPAVKWDQGTATTPATIEKDIKTAVLACYNKTAMRPNTLLMDFLVAYEVALDPSIREIIKQSTAGSERMELLALGDRVLPSQLHGLNVVVVEGAMRNTANKGATRSLASIYGDEARVLYVANGGGGWGIPSTAYTFKSKPEVVDRWQENDPPVEFVRAWECVDEKVCAPDTGYSIRDTLASI